ncbi:MAG: hypothetical protein AB7K52_11365 [Phycisphaerales bacterium]
MHEPEILIAPASDLWRTALQRPAPDAQARRFREQLGLPTDRPIILSGHQPTIWHAGILAKWFAIAHAARSLGAAAAWIVVDQDPDDFSPLRVPVRVPASSGTPSIEPRTWLLAGDEIGAMVRAGRPAGAIEPVSIRAVPSPADLAGAGAAFALESIEPSLRRLRAALEDARLHSTTAAEQLARAIAACTAHLAPPPHLLFATRLARTDLFRSLVDRMRTDPRACVSAYNAAVQRLHGAGIVPLAEQPAKWELPLWHLPGPGAPDRSRRRVWSDALASVPAAELAPRALLLTGLLRFAGCELFVHGTGGGGADGSSGYDAITTHWLHAWLGAPLAPTATVTATLPLPLAEQATRLTTPGDVHAAKWHAHRMRHDPAMVGDAGAAAEKARWLEAIRTTRDRRERASAFAQMHAGLRTARERAAAQLARAEAHAADTERRARESAVLTDRTWPFVLHDDAALRHLSNRVAGALGLAPSTK